MPRIVEYEIVLRRLLGEGFQSLYPNGGAFGFPRTITQFMHGWIGPPDSSIRPELRKYARSVGEPCVERLTAMAVRAWRDLLPGVVLAMPGSHWSFELSHGSSTWLPALLREIGVNPRSLATADAIEFLPEEQPSFELFLRGLVNGLTGSDFALVFPGRSVITTIHHHKQLWWVSTNKALIEALRQIKAD